MQIERSKTDDASARVPSSSPVFNLKCRAGIFRHDLTPQYSHLVSFQHIPAKRIEFFHQVIGAAERKIRPRPEDREEPPLFPAAKTIDFAPRRTPNLQS